jgi:hypothetical protein
VPSAELRRRVEKLVGYPPLAEMSDRQRRELHQSLLEAGSFEDLPAKWQAATLKAEQNRPNLLAAVGHLVLPRRGRFPSPRDARLPVETNAATTSARQQATSATTCSPASAAVRHCPQPGPQDTQEAAGPMRAEGLVERGAPRPSRPSSAPAGFT